LRAGSGAVVDGRGVLDDRGVDAVAVLKHPVGRDDRGESWTWG
jgi:hypothetical protein